MKKVKEETLFEFVIKAAKFVLKDSGKHLPQIFYTTGKKLETNILQWNNEESKDKMLLKLRELIKRKGIGTYIIAMEGWVGEDIFRRPSKDPNRKSALIIMEFNNNMKHKSIYQLFTKKDEKIVFGKKVVMSEKDEAHSIWNFYVEDDCNEAVEFARLRKFFRIVPREEFNKRVDDYAEKYGIVAESKEEMMSTLFDMIKQGRIIPKKITK